METILSVLTQEVFKLILVVIGGLCSVGIMRILDGRLSKDKKTYISSWWNDPATTSRDKAIYLSAQCMGVCILVGFALS